MRILLTDGLQRKTLAAARSLSRAGNEIYLAEYTRINPTAFSKHVTQRLHTPNPAKVPELYLQWLMQTIEQYSIDLLLPMDEAVMDIVVSHQIELKQRVYLLVPELDSYWKAKDKGEAVFAAGHAGAVCPRTYRPSNLKELYALGTAAEFPLLIKPKLNSGSRGIRVIRNQSELMAYCVKLQHEKEAMPILQQYIEQGTKYDVCLLYDEQGTLVTSFVQEELRQYPEPMGPSTIQRSIYNEELVIIADKIMKSIGWKGIAEVEFMRNPVDGQYYFMEINARFWASLQCAISAGVNFPLLTQYVASGQPIDEVAYQEQVMTRWLFPGDLLRFITYRNKVVWDPPFFPLGTEGIVDDVYDSQDKAPVLGVFLAMLRFLFDVSMWKYFFWR